MPKISSNSIETLHSCFNEINIVLGSLVSMYTNAQNDSNSRYSLLGEKLTAVTHAISALREVGQYDAADRLCRTLSDIENSQKMDADGTLFDVRKHFSLPCELPAEVQDDLNRRLNLITTNIVGIAKLLKGAV